MELEGCSGRVIRLEYGRLSRSRALRYPQALPLPPSGEIGRDEDMSAPRGFPMHKCLIAILFVLTLAPPVAAKERSKSQGDNPKPNYAVGIDSQTGECQIRKLGFQADAPEGFRLLSIYESQEKAEAAKTNTPECGIGANQNAAKNEGAVKAAEKDCHSRAQKSGSNLLGFFSNLTSGATEESTFVECMKKHGYETKK